MRVYLVRHGAAQSVHPGGDAARELTSEGRAAMLAHARALVGRIRASAIWHSPYVRARQTAEILAEVLGLPLRAEVGLASGNASGAQVLAIARGAGEGAILVGHNPEMAEALGVVAGRGVGVPPGTVAECELEDGQRGRLAWSASPGEVPAA